MGLDRIPTATQIHKRELFKLGSPWNHIVDDIHSHWESYLHQYGVLANAPYSQCHPREGWDAVYMWESLEEHEPMLANTYGKKAAKPSLMVVVAPTTVMTISSTSSTRLPVSRGSQSIMVPRCLGRGVACRWSFAPTAECYLSVQPHLLLLCERPHLQQFFYTQFWFNRISVSSWI